MNATRIFRQLTGEPAEPRRGASNVSAVTDVSCPFAQYRFEDATQRLVMSTIDEVRAAEKRVQEILEALKKADAADPDYLGVELQKATDEYARAVRELNST